MGNDSYKQFILITSNCIKWYPKTYIYLYLYFISKLWFYINLLSIKLCFELENGKKRGLNKSMEVRKREAKDRKNRRSQSKPKSIPQVIIQWFYLIIFIFFLLLFLSGTTNFISATSTTAFVSSSTTRSSALATTTKTLSTWTNDDSNATTTFPTTNGWMEASTSAHASATFWLAIST